METYIFFIQNVLIPFHFFSVKFRSINLHFEKQSSCVCIKKEVSERNIVSRKRLHLKVMLLVRSKVATESAIQTSGALTCPCNVRRQTRAPCKSTAEPRFILSMGNSIRSLKFRASYCR